MQWIPIERQGGRSGTAEPAKTNNGCAQTSKGCLRARREVAAASLPFNFSPPHDSEWAGKTEKRTKRMVPVNGTRVGRVVEERKRSEVQFSWSATGTAVFDTSAMNRLEKKDE